MQTTPKLGLKKPDLNDYVNVADLNDNADLIDAAVGGVEDSLAAHKAERSSLTQVGHVQLSNAINSTSNALAATPSAVKQAYDRADAAFTSASNGKLVVGNAITGVDDSVVIPADPSFIQLAEAIQQISTGKKWAIGTNRTSTNFLEVAGLSFRPSTIVISHPTTSAWCTVYTQTHPNDFSVFGTQYRIDGTTYYINSTGFRLRVNDPGKDYIWYVFE